MIFEKYKKFLDDILEEQKHDQDFNFVTKTIRILKSTNNYSDAEIDQLIKNEINSLLFISHHVDEDGESTALSLYKEHLERIYKGQVKPFKKSSYEFYVYVKDYEEKVNRRISIPAKSTMADLAYAILTTFMSTASHLYNIEYNNEIYTCGVGEDEIFLYNKKMHYLATESILGETGITIGDEMLMEYDFGISWQFVIRLEKIDVEDKIILRRIPNLLSGAGYGIFEDDSNQFYELMAKEHVGNKYVFNLNKYQKELKGMFPYIKSCYENIE